MPHSDAPVPTKLEIKRQIARMMGDDIFASKAKQTELLRVIVDATLHNQDITEKFIREHVFPTPPYELNSNIARRTIDLVRDNLTEYYADAGKDDPVIITLPKSPKEKRVKFQAGKAYEPRFSYNPRYPPLQKLLVAQQQLRQLSPRDVENAVYALAELAKVPGFAAAAHIALVEGVCMTLAFKIRQVLSPKESLKGAHELIAFAVSLGSETWHTHAVRGMVTLFQHDFSKAESEFDAALTLNRVETERYAGYVIFLMTMGRTNDALELAKLSATEQVDNAMSQAFYGLLLYVSGDFDEAEERLVMAVESNRHCWLANNLLAILLIDTNRGDMALDLMTHTRILVAEKDFFMSGLTYLCAVRDSTLSEEKVEEIALAALVSQGFEGSRDDFQVALSFMATAECNKKISEADLEVQALDKAKKRLYRAYHRYNPMALWIHLWPFLRPLRSHPDFEAKLMRLGFPFATSK